MTGFLLDTNIISELVNPRPEPRVTAWVETAEEDLLFFSVLTLGEIRKGIALLPRRSRKSELEAWVTTRLRPRFEGRILPADEPVAERWGQIAAAAGRNRWGLPVIDGLLAATALHHDLTLVTRKSKDVARTGASVFNPWER